MYDYIITIPNTETYKYLVWDYLDGKKFQLHRCEIILQGMELTGTFYFNPESINDFMLSRIGADYVKVFGKITFEQRPPKSKVKRHFTKTDKWNAYQERKRKKLAEQNKTTEL